MIFRVLMAVFVLVSGCSGGAFAQDGGAEGDETSAAKEQSRVLRQEVGEVMQGLEQKQAFHFMVIYANYNIISTVKAVQDDVREAIVKCGENNPQMKGDLDARFAQWSESVGEGLEEAQGNINNMILAQNYLPKLKFDQMFGTVDKTRAVNSSNFEKTPVTSPEACEFMLSKMDETEESMTMMLDATLQSYPSMLQKTQE